MAHYDHIIPSQTYSVPVSILLAPLVERLAHEIIESVRDMAQGEGMDEAIVHTLGEVNAAIHGAGIEGHYGAEMMMDYLGGYGWGVKLATLLRVDRVLRRYARMYV